MNLSNIGRNPGRNSSGSIYAGGLALLQNSGLKSVQERQKRQQEASGQIEFWENQKENLRNGHCSSPEEIAKKLEKLHSYEDGIAAAKMSYNNAQMYHLMDEAREKAEKIAKEAEKSAPKTKEERMEEMIEEITGEIAGTENQGDGMLSEMLEETSEMLEELEEELALKALVQEPDMNELRDADITLDSTAVDLAGMNGEAVDTAALKASERAMERLIQAQEAAAERQQELYAPLDIRV